MAPAFLHSPLVLESQVFVWLPEQSIRDAATPSAELGEDLVSLIRRKKAGTASLSGDKVKLVPKSSILTNSYMTISESTSNSTTGMQDLARGGKRRLLQFEGTSWERQETRPHIPTLTKETT